MFHRWHYGAAAVILVCLATSFASAEITGTYACQGTNPDGSGYSGTVTITAQGAAYAMSWSIGGSGHNGVAILMDGYLSSSWGVAGRGPGGIVVYKVEADGRLVGKWSNPSGGQLGTETLTHQ